MLRLTLVSIITAFDNNKKNVFFNLYVLICNFFEEVFNSLSS